MKTVAEILKAKGNAVVYSIEPSATVFEAVALMAEKNVGALLVMEGEKIVGMVTERDYARKVVLLGRSSSDTPVRDIMTAPVFTVPPDCTVHDAMQVMTERRVRHLPVVAGDAVQGVVSIGDLVASVIEEQRHHIADLETYIRG